MTECDDVLLSLVCDISGNFTCPGQAGPVFRLDLYAVGKSGVLVGLMESDEIMQH